MKGKRLLTTILALCLCLCACSSRDIGLSESSGSLVPSSPGVYRYYDIPGFPRTNTIPSKITYHKVMLGEEFEITDASQIEQIMELLDEVELDGSSVERDDDDELHQVIDFYQDAEDEDPLFSLCFLEYVMYIETREGSSELYPTLNWIDRGTDDESKINHRIGKLIDSWARPESPLLPSEESEGTEQNSAERASDTSEEAEAILLDVYKPMIAHFPQRIDSRNPISPDDAYYCFQCYAICQMTARNEDYDQWVIKGANEYDLYYSEDVVESFVSMYFGIPADAVRQIEAYTPDRKGYMLSVYSGKDQSVLNIIDHVFEGDLCTFHFTYSITDYMEAGKCVLTLKKHGDAFSLESFEGVIPEL